MPSSFIRGSPAICTISEEKIGMTAFDKLIYILDRKIPLSILDIIEYINDEVRHQQYIPDDKYFIS
jgi:hypothetical protein